MRPQPKDLPHPRLICLYPSITNRAIIKCIGKFIYSGNEKRKALHVSVKFEHKCEKKSCFLRGIEHGGKAIFIATLRKYPI